MREIPFKNYVKLFLLVMVTLFITVGTSLIYQNYRKSIKSYLSKNIHNINAEEMDIYLQENDYVIIFIASAKDNSHDDESEKMLSELSKKDIKQFMFFINRDKKSNVNHFEEKYNLKVEKDMVLLIEDGKIKNHIVLKEYNINELTNLFKGDFDD